MVDDLSHQVKKVALAMGASLSDHDLESLPREMRLTGEEGGRKGEAGGKQIDSSLLSPTCDAAPPHPPMGQSVIRPHPSKTKSPGLCEKRMNTWTNKHRSIAGGREGKNRTSIPILG